MSDILSMDEIEEMVVPLYYMQKINFEAADEYVNECRPLWKRIPKDARLRDSLTEEARAMLRNHTLYTRQWGTRAHETRFTMTAALSPLLQPGAWPAFDVTTEDVKKKAAIDAWTDLIQQSEEAGHIRDRIQSTATAINSALARRPLNLRGEEYRGWYVHIHTSRRTTYGWVVGGRGQTVHVLPDLLAGMRRITGHGSTSHNHKIPLLSAGDAVSRQIVNGVSALPTGADDIQKYSLKTADIAIIYPPDMAMERKVWVNDALVESAKHLPEARDRYKAKAEWTEKVNPLRIRRQQYDRWTNGIPKDLGDAWFNPDDPPSIYGTESQGIREALLILMEKAAMDMETLRGDMTAKYLALHPDQMLTEAEQTLLDSPPPGKDTVMETLAELLAEKVGSRLLPPF